MRVLVACEFSGRVRDAFTRLGHEAWSCDLIPSETPGNHYQGDVLDILDEGWDIMIAHPPCTDLAVSGARHFYRKKQEQKDAIEFFRKLLKVDIKRTCIENPITIIPRYIRHPDQIIQPWMFGHKETKSTCLWLKNLPLLKPTKVMKVRNENLTPSGQNKILPSPDRWKTRSRTYKGIAEAMAEQWGGKGRKEQVTLEEELEGLL